MENNLIYPEGIYSGVVTDQQFSKSSNDNPQFILTFDLIGRAVPGGMEACSGTSKVCFMTITPKTVKYVLADLAEIGFDGSSFEKLDPRTPNFCNFIGLEIALSCEHEFYEGEKKERWRIHRDRGAAAFEELPCEEVRKLDAMFAAALKKSPPAASQSKPALQPAQPTNPPSTNLPF